MHDDTQRLTELYHRWSGRQPHAIERLAGAGSNRAYYRMTDDDGQSVIGCVGTSAEENRAFVYLAGHFGQQRLPVPEVLAVTDDALCYLQTDLGRVSLFDALSAGRKSGGNYSEAEQALLSRTIRLLPHVQIEGARGLDFSRCYPKATFDTEGVFFDLNYFKYCFLKTTGVDFNEVSLEADFRALAADLTDSQGEDMFLCRDFQARNVMLDTQGAPFLIDFQGGRRGPCHYDLASFLWQASARYGDELRRKLCDEYYDEASRLTDMPVREEFDRRLRLFVFFRTLQVLGAYGFRGRFERKQHFIDSIPPALENLRHLMETSCLPYPCLADTLARMVQQSAEQPVAADTPLVVTIYSFSYKKGLPDDTSGNGGGYVFDCRGTNNPGRYERYRSLTGLDAEVKEFLEDDGEILTFLDSVYRLADAHVGRYIERGFTHLMFSFGCTGGQHRSVYCAQHLAEHISSKHGVEVHLYHREQKISQVFPKKFAR